MKKGILIKLNEAIPIPSTSTRILTFEQHRFESACPLKCRPHSVVDTAAVQGGWSVKSAEVWTWSTNAKLNVDFPCHGGWYP